MIKICPSLLFLQQFNDLMIIKQNKRIVAIISMTKPRRLIMNVLIKHVAAILRDNFKNNYIIFYIGNILIN